MGLVRIKECSAQSLLRLVVFAKVKLAQFLPLQGGRIYLGSEDTILLLAPSDTHSFDKDFCPGDSWISIPRQEIGLASPKEKGEGIRETAMPSTRHVWVWRCHNCFAGPIVRDESEECQRCNHIRCENCITHRLKLKRPPTTPSTRQ
ncbi:hypothetical protein B0T26DRAFT_261752 [Lasiosphaeria miniovina]|uniref:Uncharacterized protein n=1 Tax=Lasiosphaeria miniovina TaxID=1954250 RepID=A0AA40AWU9_9PEZI|nr:uncharacterized protein B0T26DRAFT_261752 [Lasiosphaeria miniovina]KAK0723482.1 hypothetical protein B0T26DRAFT_261752 [Lasiosphaeria miniovina]